MPKSFWGRLKCTQCGNPTTSVTGVCAECRTVQCNSPFGDPRCIGKFLARQKDLALCAQCRGVAKSKLKAGEIGPAEYRAMHLPKNQSLRQP